MTLLVLAIFYALDSWKFRNEPPRAARATPEPIRVRGQGNIVLIGLIIVAILLSGTWTPNIKFDVYGTHVELQNILRDVALIFIALVSLSAHR